MLQGDAYILPLNQLTSFSWGWENIYNVKSFAINSNISSLAIDEIARICHQSNAAISYVYFDYKNREAQTGDYIIRTILKQLLVQLDVIPRDLEAVHDDCCSHFKTPEEVTFIRQLASVAASFASVYIVLDALDECADATLEDLINFIQQMKDSHIKFFCTFRPSVIKDQLSSSIIHSIHAHDDDVRNYLSIRLGKEWRHNRQLLPPIINTVATAAEGKSLYIVYFANQL